ncbi:hypothetical protein QAD02_015657 [Eretmocerus hayati]|uniref:Uncharacterized protein n=1 Tax=Eretmocerus hayati TaxID=131215 RepID=A0ACC2P8E7_9HYME|nr:hypothetical protein QAD02_015657 [Eretmocerus hayati]
MSVILYYHPISQPARALYIFMKKCNIPFDLKFVNLRKNEQQSPEFEKLNPFKKVPIIDHNGFILSESVAILRYLSRKFNCDDHWYPKDIDNQARVDQYLEWQHSNTRHYCTSFFLHKYLLPLKTQNPANEKEVAKAYDQMMICLDQIENIWLKDKPFLTGKTISVADILGACEIEQPRLGGYDPRTGRPNLTAWLNRVIEETSPYYQEAHTDLNQIASQNN